MREKNFGKGLTCESFESLYEVEVGWDIDNQPQPVVLKLLNDMNFVSPILDIGCGYGVNTLFLGEKGYNICGVDFVKKVISAAKKKCVFENVSFMVRDIFKMGMEFGEYKTILDSGLFHNLSNPKRESYVENLSKYLLPGSFVYILGFDEKCCTNTNGPKGLSKNEIVKLFEQFFDIIFIKNSIFLTKFNGSVDAFFVKLHKV